MSMMQKGHTQQSQVAPIQLVLGQQQAPQDNMMKSMSRTKRAADDLFELGDRLTEKLQQKTEEMKAKMGNASCVLKELDIIDQNENLDVSGMVQSIENGEWGKFEDEWLQEQHIKD